MEYILLKRNLHEYLKVLGSKYDVIAPVRQGESVIFKHMGGKDTVCLEYDTTNSSVKKHFLVPGQILLEFTGQDAVKPDSPGKTIIFGLHQYDACAIDILDEAFSSPIEDEYYLERRENAVIVAVESGDVPNSFVNELDLDRGKGYDIMLHDLGDKYLVTCVSKKGEDLLDPEYVRRVTGKDEFEKKEDPAPGKLLDIESIMKFLDKGPNQKLWHELAEKCFACGACAYACPVCHCFDVQDRLDLKGESGTRCRDWDSCMLADFAGVAGGGNFRPGRNERIHNWYHHKFSRAVKERGKPDCVGCGRCTTVCPAKIDIHEVLVRCEEGGN
ncbi:4Fe-4S dicluster domain-containing protein [Candidatus Altiarchaeota archaeon]